MKSKYKERRREYYQRPEVKERRREYNQRPEVKERQREYYQRLKARELLHWASLTDEQQERHIWEFIKKELDRGEGEK